MLSCFVPSILPPTSQCASSPPICLSPKNQPSSIRSPPDLHQPIAMAAPRRIVFHEDLKKDFPKMIPKHCEVCRQPHALLWLQRLLTTARATIRPSTGQPTNPPASKSAPSPRGSRPRRQDSCSQGAAPIGRPQRQWCLLAPCPPPSLSPGEVPLWRITGPLMAPPGSRGLAEAVSRHSPPQSPR